MLQQFIGYIQAGGAQCGHRLFEVHRVPAHVGSDDEIQATGAVVASFGNTPELLAQVLKTSRPSTSFSEDVHNP
jgi:hypothetical protein